MTADRTVGDDALRQPLELSVPTATLLPSARKARYGVAYLRNVCAQAGVGMNETPADEDVLAVDCSVEFAEAPVRVQVKCTSQFTIAGRSASWPLEEGWVRAWSHHLVPVYFVLVIVGSDISCWLDHHAKGTSHRAAAFWRRLPPAVGETRLDVPKTQRLTADTLDIWRRDLLASFSGGGAS
ncbi:protein of unknown function [Blastococcus aggregatus]|uniref:DUF4365 domain-containing protein n=1 Tax=Blastococcus aggregatus TaxID=38502 RepID=A0A285V5P2_9ACTN|nr:DUF4365 domain-containing protein [Blastococcus aggregatus]SOC47821.1 protein of unknown function [Blastococcus aggregatus]